MRRKFTASILALILTIIPTSVLAHGTEEQHKKELLLNDLIQYATIFSAILVVLFTSLILYNKSKMNKTQVKTKDGRNVRQRLTQQNKFYTWLGLIAGIILIIALGTKGFTNTNTEEASVSFPDIHGLAFTDDGEQIYVPAHDGIKVFENGKWSVSDIEKNDYMGFSKVDDGFYSSGHPSPSSNKKNPLGIVKYSGEEGKLNVLDLYGEVDFHGMAVGYQSHAIYVFNPQQNSRMDEVGLYYSKDDTKTWNKADMKGLEDNPTSMAAHPVEESIVAVGTQTGVYVSEDNGMTFEKIIEDIQVTAVSFTNEGNLLVGGAGINDSQKQGILLAKYDLKSKEQDTIVNPVEKEDYILYVSQNPENENNIVLATGNKDIFITNDHGESWNEIADKGESKPLGNE